MRIAVVVTAVLTAAQAVFSAPSAAAKIPETTKAPMSFDESVKNLKHSVLYDFNQLSLCGMAIDGEGDWHKADVVSNTDSAGIFEGAGSIKVTCALKKGQHVRLAKGYQGVDFSAFKAMRFHIKPTVAGMNARFYLFTDGWKLAEMPDQALKPNVWNTLDVMLTSMPKVKLDVVNCWGIIFSAADECNGTAYVDLVECWGDKAFGRDAARASTTGFEVVKQTKPVSVAIDGSVAHGVVQPGIISYNIGDPTNGNQFVSDKLKELGPGVMRMWSFGGYGRQINFNPAEGVYQFDYLDKEVSHLLSLGWQPLFCLGECQSWNRNPTRSIPQDNAKWAEMAAAVVRHYNVDLKLGLKYWEVWNEHDIGFWGGTEEEYLALLKVAGPAMKKADPTITIFAGAWSNPAMVKKVGGAMLDKVPPKGSYDGISWHNYLVSSNIPADRIMQLTPMLQAPAWNAWEHLKKRGLDKTLVTGVTELNINPSATTDWRQETMVAGVYWASALYNYMVQNVSMCTYFTANGDDEYGAITDRARPAYQSSLLFAKRAGVVGKQWLKTDYDQEQAPTLEALGLASDKELSIIVVNKDTKGTAFDLRLSLANLPALDSLQVYGTSDRNLEVSKLGAVAVTKGSAAYLAAPFSVTVLTGTFKSARKAAPLTAAAPTKAAIGLPILGQYSWAGTPAGIAKAAAPVKIDGTLASFASAPVTRIEATDTAKIVGRKLKSFKDLTADVRMMWDAKNFYIAVEVHQDHAATNAQKGGNIWNGDCIELYLSSSAKLADQSRINKSSMDYQIVMGPTSADGTPVFNCFNGDFKNVTIAAKPAKTGYIVTAAIPLSNLENNDWATGKKIRFDVAVSGAGEDGNSARKIFWNATSNAWDSPDEWGLAELQ